MVEGYNITLNDDPIDSLGKFDVNFALTRPLLPWLLVTLPHITRNLDPAFSVWALYIYAMRLPR